MTSINRIACGICLCIDTEGEYALGVDEETAIDNYRDQIGDICGPVSIVHLTADCPLPRPIVGRLVVPEAAAQPVSVTFES